MKRHVQQTGIRKWAGDDFIELQAEPLKVLDGFFAQYDPCVVCGCELTAATGGTHTLTGGLVSIDGPDEEGRTVRRVVPVMPMEGIPASIELVMDYQPVMRNYEEKDAQGNNIEKPIAYSFVARPKEAADASKPVFVLSATSPRFNDVIQDEGHMMVTAAEKEYWNSIRPLAEAYMDELLAGIQTVSTEYDYYINKPADFTTIPAGTRYIFIGKNVEAPTGDAFTYNIAALFPAGWQVPASVRAIKGISPTVTLIMDYAAGTPGQLVTAGGYTGWENIRFELGAAAPGTLFELKDGGRFSGCVFACRYVAAAAKGYYYWFKSAGQGLTLTGCQLECNNMTATAGSSFFYFYGGKKLHIENCTLTIRENAKSAACQICHSFDGACTVSGLQVDAPGVPVKMIFQSEPVQVENMSVSCLTFEGQFDAAHTSAGYWRDVDIRAENGSVAQLINYAEADALVSLQRVRIMHKNGGSGDGFTGFVNMRDCVTSGQFTRCYSGPLAMDEFAAANTPAGGWNRQETAV